MIPQIVASNISKNFPTSSSLHYKKMASTVRNRMNYSKKLGIKNKIKSIYQNINEKELFTESVVEEYDHNQYYIKLSLLELLNAIYSMMSILCGILHYEISTNHEPHEIKDSMKVMNSGSGWISGVRENNNIGDTPFEYNHHIDSLLYICTFNTIMLITTIIFYDLTEMEYHKRINLNSRTDTIFSTGRYKKMLFKILFFLLHPTPFTKDLMYTSTNDNFQINVDRPLNSLFCICLLTRFYFLFRFVLFNDSFMDPNTDAKCRAHNFNKNYLFTIKSMIKFSPTTLYMLACIISVYSFAFTVRIFERELSEASGMNFNSFWNTLWFILITMTTVGYGDFYAVTTEGRMFAMIACVIGVFLVSMMVVTMNNFLDMNPAEERIFNILEICTSNEEINKTAKKVISSFTNVVLKNEYSNGPTVRETISAENSQYRKLNWRTKKCKVACDKKRFIKKFTPFTHSLENLAVLVKQYDNLENQQEKLRIEVFDIKKKLEEIYNYSNDNRKKYDGGIVGNISD